MSKPHNIPSYYVPYIERVSEDDIIQALTNGLGIFSQLIANLPGEKGNFSYAEGKWTAKEVLQHVIDSERIFNYRALCFARGERQSLPGFNEKAYVNLVDVSSKSTDDLVTEFETVRASTLVLYQSFTEEEMQAEGNANDLEVTVNLIAHLTEGHMRHHLHVIKERYL